ncbi:MAG: YiaA/YiaB family inner membrane protein [Bacteroidia bacterium]|nr:YiaA/YiaB family inner membrane protein [Bacteroidia bacterium]MDW8159149.1 YiaA/YiaB family inner membrane protein [Bacteroidia bacterium]
MAWISFIIAIGGTILGIVLLDVSLSTKVFFAMGYIFSISSCFTLAKVIRDKHEADKLLAKIEKAKTEKLITKYGIEE